MSSPSTIGDGSAARAEDDLGLEAGGAQEGQHVQHRDAGAGKGSESSMTSTKATRVGRFVEPHVGAGRWS
jgi:hypothetical protein